MGREGRRGRRDLERSLVPGPGPGTGIQPRVQSGTRGWIPVDVAASVVYVKPLIV